MHRLDLVLHSHPKEFLGNGVKNHVNSKEKNPLYRRLRGGSNPRHCTTQDSEHNTLLTELFRPNLTFNIVKAQHKPSQTATSKLISETCAVRDEE